MGMQIKMRNLCKKEYRITTLVRLGMWVIIKLNDQYLILKIQQYHVPQQELGARYLTLDQPL